MSNFKVKLTRKINESPVSGNKAHLKSHYKHHLCLERNLKDIIIYWQTIILHPSSSNYKLRFTWSSWIIEMDSVRNENESFKWAVPVPFHSWLDMSWKRKIMKLKFLGRGPIQMFQDWKVYFLVPICKVVGNAAMFSHSHPKDFIK